MTEDKMTIEKMTLGKMTCQNDVGLFHFRQIVKLKIQPGACNIKLFTAVIYRFS